MAVNIQGEHLGYISSGCAEAAIVATAVETIQGPFTTRTVRYGAGSPYIDVVLPCGSGIDVHFDATVAPSDPLSHLSSEIAARRTVATCPSSTSPQPRAHFIRTYDPVPRMIIAGRSINVDFVARFAHDLEWDIIAALPRNYRRSPALPPSPARIT